MYFVSHSDVIAVADDSDAFHKQRQDRAAFACSIRSVVLDFLSPGMEQEADVMSVSMDNCWRTTVGRTTLPILTGYKVKVS